MPGVPLAFLGRAVRASRKEYVEKKGLCVPDLRNHWIKRVLCFSVPPRTWGGQGGRTQPIACMLWSQPED